MRVAALYDIHGNLPALEAVLRDVDDVGVDRIVVGGDVVPGPMPGECLDLLRELSCPLDLLSGNGEREVLASRRGAESEHLPDAVRASIRWVAGSLSPEQLRWLESWPSSVSLDVDGQQVLFCHATPRNDFEIFTPRTPEERLLPVFRDVAEDLVVCGHTHMQFQRSIGGRTVVNAGSVGMVFGDPGACWLLLAPDVRPRRSLYDLEAAAERVRRTSYPQAESFADVNVLAPPSEASMIESLERAAL